MQKELGAAINIQEYVLWRLLGSKLKSWPIFQWIVHTQSEIDTFTIRS